MFEGKTLFNYYLLVRLLQRKQVILFSPDGERVFLFYDKEVYAVSMETLAGGDVSLPNPESSSNVFIWSLFDIREPKEPKSFLVTRPCFPVQTALPNPDRYQTWEKERMPLLTGLPLWTHDELVQGYVLQITFLFTSERTLPRLQYQDQYHSLLDALRKVYGSSSLSPSAPSSDPLAVYPGARALLEERYSEEDTAPPSPEDALDYLLDAAIDRFGHSARDVFGAVFNFSEMTRRHKDAFDLTYKQLRDAVSALSKNRSANHSISHRILALSPVDQGPFMRVGWDVDFKSDWISRNVLQKLGEAKDDEICEQISFFQNISQARGLARRLLEPFAHRLIANTTDGFWPLINMKFNATDAPLLTLDRDFPVQDNVRFIKVKRELVKLQSIANLSTCLKHNSYYVPTDPNFPLFDAFIIEFDYANSSAILWVLQMTMSRTHEGSTRGYQKIREIIAILKDELREDSPQKRRKMAEGQAITPLVQVRFLLVVPKDESQSQNLRWQFPKGWSQNRRRNDHNGNVYRLEVPLVVCSTIIKNVSSFEHVASRYSENAHFLLLSTCSTCPIMVFFFVYSQF